MFSAPKAYDSSMPALKMNPQVHHPGDGLRNPASDNFDLCVSSNTPPSPQILFISQILDRWTAETRCDDESRSAGAGTIAW